MSLDFVFRTLAVIVSDFLAMQKQLTNKFSPSCSYYHLSASHDNNNVIVPRNVTLTASLSGTLLQTLPRIGYVTEGAPHTPSITFRHLPPNSARIGYITEGAPQHSEHNFPAPSFKLCQNWLRHWRGTPHSEHNFPAPSSKLCQNLVTSTKGAPHTPSITFRHLPPNSARIGYVTDSTDSGFNSAGIRTVGGYKRNALYHLSRLLQSYYHLSTNEKLSVSWEFWEVLWR